jgi:hypothetical protein
MGNILGNNLYTNLDIKNRGGKIMEITAGDWFIAWILLIIGTIFVYIMYKIMTATPEEINERKKK